MLEKIQSSLVIKFIHILVLFTGSTHCYTENPFHYTLETEIMQQFWNRSLFLKYKLELIIIFKNALVFPRISVSCTDARLFPKFLWRVHLGPNLLGLFLFDFYFYFWPEFRLPRELVSKKFQANLLVDLPLFGECLWKFGQVHSHTTSILCRV